MDVFEQEQGGTCVAEIVEANMWRTSPLQERSESSLTQVGRVNQAADVCGEDEPLILV